MHTENHVLYLSYDGMTDPLGQSQVLPYLQGLSKAGYRFTLISFEKKERFDKNRKTIEQICLDSNIRWIPMNYTKKPPLLSTMWDVNRLQKKVEEIIAEDPVHHMHCRSYITALVGLRLKRKKGISFVFDMRGFWADERVDGGIWNLSNPLYKRVYNYFKSKEKAFLQEASYTVSLTHRAKKEIESWNLEKQSRISVIPCCVNLAHFSKQNIQPTIVNRIKNEWKLKPENKLIGYVGSIGTWYMLDEMLDFFQVLHQKQPQFIFAFFTQEQKELILKRASQKGIPTEAIRIQSVSYSEIPSYLSILDVSLFFILPSYSKMASSPTKQGELMAMGIPVICNSGVGDSDWVVNEFQSGWVLDSLKKNDFDQFEWSPSDIFTENIQRGAYEFYSLEKGVESYKQIYQSIHG